WRRARLDGVAVVAGGRRGRGGGNPHGTRRCATAGETANATDHVCFPPVQVGAALRSVPHRPCFSDRSTSAAVVSFRFMGRTRPANPNIATTCRMYRPLLHV